MNSYLLISIVGKGDAQKLMDAIRGAGGGGGTICYARGTASSDLLALLGLGDSHQEVLLTLVKAFCHRAVLCAIARVPHVRGICASIGTQRTYVKTTASIDGEGISMDGKWKMIQVICNSGFADDVMAAARKAGAGGGTIINGRGTGKPDDAKFFGLSLVPEKDILLIVVEAEKADAVFDAVEQTPCMQERGSGIAFTMPVDSFTMLGKR